MTFIKRGFYLICKFAFQSLNNTQLCGSVFIRGSLQEKKKPDVLSIFLLCFPGFVRKAINTISLLVITINLIDKRNAVF